MAASIKSSKVKLPSEVVTEIINKAKDGSTIAALSPAKPKKFADSTHMVFNPSAEAEVVEEGAKKGSYDIDLTPREGKRFKVVTTTRVSDERVWADEDNKLEIVSSILADQAAAISRAIDYVVYHAVNPKSGAVMDGYKSLTSEARSLTATSDPVSDIDALVDLLEDYDINGMALSKKYASELRKIRVPATGLRLFPEIPLNLDAGSIDGVTAATSGTVSGRKCTVDPKVKAIMGDFSLINWGMVRDMWSEVIEYGDPDNTGQDLKGANQIAYRTEAVLSYVVFDPNGFAVLKSA